MQLMPQRVLFQAGGRFRSHATPVITEVGQHQGRGKKTDAATAVERDKSSHCLLRQTNYPRRHYQRGTHISPLAVLNQHQADHGQGGHDLQQERTTVINACCMKPNS